MTTKKHGRPKLHWTQERSKRLSLRLTRIEYLFVYAAAIRRRQNVSDYARETLLNLADAEIRGYLD